MTPKDFHRVEALRDAGEVKRLHTVQTHTPHTIARHVYGSQIIAAELCRVNNVYPGEVLRILLVHDAPEIDTGDVPAPTKRNSPEIRDALDSMEEAFYASLDIFVPEGDDIEHAIVKASDTLDLAFAALSERRMGNRMPRIDLVFRNCLLYLSEQSHVKGVKEFVDYLEKEFRYASL